MREAEKRIWLAGTEYELRPLTAAEYIAAKREAEALEDRYGTDPETMRLLRGACLTARGVYAEDERHFSSGEEVLSLLSAHEILFAAREYVPEEKAVTEEKNMERPASQTREKKTEEDYLTYKRDIFTGEVRVEAGEERKKITQKEWTVPEEGAKERKTWNREPTGGASLRRLSDLVERDSRRYDGAFERY